MAFELKMAKLEFNSHFASNYEVIKTLGKGGFGIVFEAKNKIDNNIYAFKRIKLSKEEDEVNVMREVQTLAKLKHNNIVGYIVAWKEQPPTGWQEDRDVLLREKGIMPENTESMSQTTEEGTTSDPPVKILKVQSPVEEFFYIQMELCKEKTLKTWLSDTPLLEREKYTEKIQLHIARGINYIHKKGVMHRDIKPSNIFFSENGYHIKIGDFGHARYTRGNATICNEDSISSKSYTKYAGTRFYRSPEQKAGHSYDNKVDVYACGIIFFELMSDFQTVHEKETEFEKAKENNFLSHDFKKYSSMLNENPNDRPTIEKVLELLPMYSSTPWGQQIIKRKKIKRIAKRKKTELINKTGLMNL